MKLVFTFCSILFMLNFTPALAQQTTIINGSIKHKNMAVENIVVALLRTVDSSIVKTTLSGQDGQFVFNDIQPASYFISISAMGYQPTMVNVDAASGKTALDVIELKLQPALLAGVTVTSSKPFIEIKPDRMLVNVEASAANAGNNALEVLEKAPGVTVDKDGNISLRGKAGVNVYIDGRPSYMSGAELANLLRGMTASQLEQLEIMTNPPAKYDAAGNAGIINIKTKKIKVKGFNGNVTANYGQGVYPKTGLGASFNYRNNKLNLFGSFNHSYREEFQQFEVLRNLYNSNTQELDFKFNQKAYMPNNRNSFSGKLGIDYDITPKTNVSLVVNGMNTGMRFENNISNTITDKNGLLLTQNVGRTIMTPKISNYNAAINARHQFDTMGTEMSFDVTYINYKDKHKQKFFNSFYDNAGNLLAKPDSLNGNLPTGYDIYAARVDFTKPFSATTKFESGLKFSRVQSDNNIRFDSIINDKPIMDLYRTNYFVYQENIYAAYVNYSQKIAAKLNMQAGLRYEHTNGKGHSLTTGENFVNDYGQLFPTFYLSYEAHAKHQFGINYGRRVTRPQYRDMNPFVFIIDRYTSQSGNPNLKPHFSHNIELSHTYNSFFTTTLMYVKTSGVISEVVENNNATQEVKLIKRNIASQELFGLSVNFNKKLVKWLSVTANGNLYNNHFKGMLSSNIVDEKRVAAHFYTAFQFSFNKGWAAEVNGFYKTKSVDGISIDGRMGMISFAGSKSILKNKGKVTLNVRDPFRLQYFTNTTKFGDVDAAITGRWDNRQVTMAFNYRFGKQFKTKQPKSNSAAEEQGRIGG